MPHRVVIVVNARYGILKPTISMIANWSTYYGKIGIPIAAVTSSVNQ